MKKIFSIIVEVHLSEDNKQTAVLRNVNGQVIATCHDTDELPQMLADVKNTVFMSHESK
jgi:hypothetical protein